MHARFRLLSPTRSLAATLVLAWLATAGAWGKTYEATGLRALDGDSVMVEFPSGLEVEVRMLGVDAPEKGQPFADQVRDTLHSWIEGKRLKLETEGEERDRYNRLLAWLHDGGENLNLRLVRRGLAAVYIRPPNTQGTEPLLAAQKEAFLEKAGIWGSPGLDEDPRSFRSRRSGKKKIPLRYERHIITANTRSKVAHWPACGHVADMSPGNLRPFESLKEAKSAGYQMEKGFR